MQRKIKVESVNLHAKCWVVRPGTRYKYSKEFLDGHFVAIGHLDEVSFDQKTTFSSEDEIESLISKADIGSFTNNVKSQIGNFLSDMSIGDVVFTMTQNSIIPGVIKSSPYFDNKIIRPQQNDREKFSIRREVEWGSPISRKDIPLKISRSLLAYQAVFSLGDYSTEIYHWLSSFFINDDSYYSSLRIEQKDSINHHALKSLSEVIDRIQVLSLLSGDDGFDEGNLDISLEYIKDQMELMYDEGKLTLTAQQMLMSPGDFWLGLKTKSKRSGVLFLVLTAMIVGEIDNIAFASEEYKKEVPIAKEIIKKHGAVITEGINIEKVREQLDLGAKQQNKKFVEANPNDYHDDDVPKDTDPTIVGG